MTICGDGEYYRDFVHVSDVVAANILAMNSKVAGENYIVNIGSGMMRSINDLSKIIGGQTLNGPERAGDIRKSCADITKAKELFNWQPAVSLEQGMAELKKEWGI